MVSFLKIQDQQVIDCQKNLSTSGSAVDNPLHKASWNGDKLDGTGEVVIFRLIKQLLCLWILNG
jgi:hypothetical protein